MSAPAYVPDVAAYGADEVDASDTVCFVSCRKTPITPPLKLMERGDFG